MTKKERTYSRYTHEVLLYLANQIRITRLERKMTAQELSERAGISRSLLQRIERADPACAIGVVFEVAHLLDIPLFQSDIQALARYNHLLADKLALLPSQARPSAMKVSDDF